MKSLEDIKSDMSTLYDEVRTGTVELKQAAELANIAGKFLKAEQLQLMRDIFEKESRRPSLVHVLKAEPERLPDPVDDEHRQT